MSQPEDIQEEASLSSLLALATAAPDEVLLARYAELAESPLPEGKGLSKEEIRWVETNLAANPNWQKRWTEISRGLRAKHFRSSTRRSLAAMTLLCLVCFAWIRIVHVVDLEAIREIQRLVDDRRSPLRNIDAEAEVRNPYVFISGAWTFAPTSTFEGLNRLLSDLELNFDTSSNPVERAEIAYRVARLKEWSGSTTEALTWYERCVETGSAEFSAAAKEAIKRLLLRGRR
jgi:hypothetical protein